MQHLSMQRHWRGIVARKRGSAGQLLVLIVLGVLMRCDPHGGSARLRVHHLVLMMMLLSHRRREMWCSVRRVVVRAGRARIAVLGWV